MELPEAFRYSYLFRGLSESIIDSIIDMTVTRRCEGGEVLVRQFERSRDLLIILRGEAIIRSASGEPIAEVTSGFLLGEVSLIDDEPRSATVIAKGPCEIAVIPGEKLRATMEVDPVVKGTLLANLSRVLCQRLRAANIQLDALLSKSLR